MTFKNIIARIDRVRVSGNKAIGRCPAHPDNNPSLSLHDAGDQTLIYCHAGCRPESICAELGIRMSDLFDKPKAKLTLFRKNHRKPFDPLRISRHHTSKLLRVYTNKFLDISDSLDHHSRNVLDRAKGLQIDKWTPKELDLALSIVDQALKKQRLVSALEDLSGDFKTSGLELERKAREFRS